MVEASVDRARIGRTFVSRVVGLVRSQWQLRKNLAEFAVRAQQDGLPAEQTARIIGLARRSHQLALQLAYYDDLRGLLSTWRWLHRWLAVLLLTLTAVHILYAVRFGGVDLGVLFGEAGK